MERLRQFKERLGKCTCTRPTCTCSRGCCSSFVKNNIFVLILMASVVFGVILGILLRLRPKKWTARETMYLNFPGEIYLRMLKMLIIPLIASSIISAVGSIDAKVSGKIGLRAVCYYMLTTVISVFIGIVLVLAIRPGGHHGKFILDSSGATKETAGGVNSFLDLLRNFLPQNIVAACFEKTLSQLVPPTPATDNNNSSDSENATQPTVAPRSEWPLKVTTARGANILGILTFSLAFGIAISRLREQTRVVQLFFNGLNSAMLLMVRWVIWFTPVGICFLIAAKVAGADNPAKTFGQLGMYMVTVILGLIVHFFVILPSIYFFFVRKNPFNYMFGMLDALLCAVSTASSSATLPLTIRCASEINGVNEQIAHLVLPVGAVVNMDGTALYEAVASIFIAQVNNRPMDFGTVLVVSLTATLAAIGAAGIPEGGLVTMLIILEAVGLPANDISLILAVDWFLDRLRTTTNVWGDAVGAAVVEKLSDNDIRKMRFMQAQQPADNPAFENDIQPPGSEGPYDDDDDDEEIGNASVGSVGGGSSDRSIPMEPLGLSKGAEGIEVEIDNQSNRSVTM